MSDIRLNGFPLKATPVGTDIVYVGDSANFYTEVKCLINSFPVTTGQISGILSPANGGTGVNNGALTITLAGNLATSGAFASTFTMTGATTVTFPTSGTLATTSQIPTGAALTETNDTNVTLTLGGSASTALVNAASITAGWTGTLSLTRGGTAASLTASNGGIVYSNASTLAILAGTATAGQMLQSGASTTPAWSTTTYPATNAINTLLYASSANVMAALATANSSILVTNGSGVPAWGTTLPAFTAPSATLSNTTNQLVLGTTNTVTISSTAPASSRTYTLPDAGQNTSFVLSTNVDVTGASQAMIASTVYFANRSTLVAFTLPAIIAEGDIFTVIGVNTGGWQINQNSGQTVHWTATTATTTGTGGSLASTDQYDCITIRAINTTDLNVSSAKGNITVT